MNESLIRQKKNILIFLQISYVFRVLSCSPRTAKWCKILKSPGILTSVANSKEEGNLTEQEFLCSVERRRSEY